MADNPTVKLKHMALLKATPQDQRVNALNPTKQLPKDCYAIRFKDQKFGPAKSAPHNPMVSLTAEIVAPSNIKSPFTGEMLEIAGATLQPLYQVIGIKNEDGDGFDMSDTQKAVDRYIDFRKRCGLPIPEEGIDYENPTLDFKGVVVDAILDCKEVKQTKPPTPEQKAAGQPGDEIKGPDGKPIISYFPIIVTILGPSSVDVSNNPMLS